MKSLFNMDLSALEQRIMHIDPGKLLGDMTAITQVRLTHDDQVEMLYYSIFDMYKKDERSDLCKQMHKAIEDLWYPPKKLYGKTADLIWIDDLEVAAPQPPKRKPMPYYHHRRRF